MKTFKLILLLLSLSCLFFSFTSNDGSNSDSPCISDDASNYIMARTVYAEDGGSTITLDASEVERAYIAFNIDRSLSESERVATLFEQLNFFMSSCKFKAEAYSPNDGLVSVCSPTNARAIARGNGYLWAKAYNNRTGQTRSKAAKHPFCANYNGTCIAAANVTNTVLNAGILRY